MHEPCRRTRFSTPVSWASALTVVNDVLTVLRFPYLPRPQHEALGKTNLIARCWACARLNLCRKHDYNRSGYNLAGKDRDRFMTPKKPVFPDRAYPEFISQLVGLLEP